MDEKKGFKLKSKKKKKKKPKKQKQKNWQRETNKTDLNTPEIMKKWNTGSQKKKTKTGSRKDTKGYNLQNKPEFTKLKTNISTNIETNQTINRLE